MKVSVVVTAHNEEDKISDCLKSVENIANEIILINNSSTDRTVEIAKKFTDRIYQHENNPMLNVSKNFGFSKAKSEWILSLDADERITNELETEILNLDPDGINGFYIPRKNIIFGKWIEHTGWYPDYQLRLFKKDSGSFAEKHVHEMLQVKGIVEYLKNPIFHLNYDTIDQFLNKMIKVYTISEAKNIMQSGYKYNSIDIVRMPMSEFFKRFFAEKGYKDGMHGLVLSILMSFYHFVVFLRIWEANSFRQDDIDSTIGEGSKMLRKEFSYWFAEMQIEKQKSWAKKKLLKIRRKLKK